MQVVKPRTSWTPEGREKNKESLSKSKENREGREGGRKESRDWQGGEVKEETRKKEKEKEKEKKMRV